MEMVFCFCQRCLTDIDRDYAENGEFPAYLNASGEPRCACCGRKRKMAGTRTFEVELANVEEKKGFHQYTEYVVIRYIGE